MARKDLLEAILGTDPGELNAARACVLASKGKGDINVVVDVEKEVKRALNPWGVDSGASKPEDDQPTLHFSKEELERYVAYREGGLADKSKYWIHQESEALWDCTHGEISHTSMTELREFALRNYTSVDSHAKVISFAKAFLKHLAQLHVDQRYLSFTLFLDLPKAVKERHAVTSQIVTKKDIENVLSYPQG